jgi:hypothetical protein
LALLGLEVVIFISSNMAAVVRAGRFSIWLLVVNLNSSYSAAALISPANMRILVFFPATSLPKHCVMARTLR